MSKADCMDENIKMKETNVKFKCNANSTNSIERWKCAKMPLKRSVSCLICFWIVFQYDDNWIWATKKKSGFICFKFELDFHNPIYWATLKICRPIPNHTVLFHHHFYLFIIFFVKRSKWTYINIYSHTIILIITLSFSLILLSNFCVFLPLFFQVEERIIFIFFFVSFV